MQQWTAAQGGLELTLQFTTTSDPFCNNHVDNESTWMTPWRTFIQLSLILSFSRRQENNNTQKKMATVKHSPALHSRHIMKLVC